MNKFLVLFTMTSLGLLAGCSNSDSSSSGIRFVADSVDFKPMKPKPTDQKLVEEFKAVTKKSTPKFPDTLILFPAKSDAKQSEREARQHASAVLDTDGQNWFNFIEKNCQINPEVRTTNPPLKSASQVGDSYQTTMKSSIVGNNCPILLKRSTAMTEVLTGITNQAVDANVSGVSHQEISVSDPDLKSQSGSEQYQLDASYDGAEHYTETVSKISFSATGSGVIVSSGKTYDVKITAHVASSGYGKNVNNKHFEIETSIDIKPAGSDSSLTGQIFRVEEKGLVTSEEYYLNGEKITKEQFAEIFGHSWELDAI